MGLCIPWGVLVGAGGLNGLPQSIPVLFALTFHCSAQVSCGSLLLAQDSRDRQSVPKASLSSSLQQGFALQTGIFPPASVRGAKSAVVLIFLGPEEEINQFVYSL